MDKSIVISRTPLRVSLAGGGTDIKTFYQRESGVVVSTAIDKYIYVVVKRRFDDHIHVVYSKKEITDCVEDVQHDIVREALRMTGSGTGLDVVTMADIPSQGSGLGSSSSLTVGLLNALWTMNGYTNITPESLAAQACEIEIERLHKPIGKQDQYIAAYGGLRRFVFGSDDEVIVNSVPVVGDTLDKSLHLFYTNRTRSADDILKEQNEHTERNRLTLQGLRFRANWMWEAITTGNNDTVGSLLHDTWQMKKTLASNISDPELDEMYDTAIKAGALGGKICGAGGGGFLLVHVPSNKTTEVKTEMSKYRELPFHIMAPGSEVILALQ